MAKEAEELTARIEAHGPSAPLYLERGELHRLSGNWVAALSDFRRAEAQDPDRYGVALAFVSLFAEQRNWRVAAEYVRTHLQGFPGDMLGRQLNAEILVGQKRYSAASSEYRFVIENTKEPGPDLYLARARAAVLGDDSTGALKCLDAGIHRLGQVPALQLMAIELNRKHGEFDFAIARVHELAVRAGRKESWLVLQGEIELEAVRPVEARRSLLMAQQAIATLSVTKQSSRSVAALLSRTKELLLRANRMTESIEEKK